MEYTRGTWAINKHDNSYVVAQSVNGRQIKFVADCAESEKPLSEVIGNVQLICTAVNSCIKVNPENPLAVAEQIFEMHKTLKKCLMLLENITTEDFGKGKDKPLRKLIESVLAKAESMRV
jgi:fumarate hydratase class II